MENILISVTGLTPQVITETLYYLSQVRNPPFVISEIYVITTLEGRNAILKSLFDNGKGKYFQFLKEYDIKPESILFDNDCIFVARDNNGNMIKDIRTTEESRAFANFIIQIIKRKTMEEDKAIIASVAGGRKTMSVYLANALQLFGRQQDILTHVLVSEDFEQHPEFYYIPRKSKLLKTKNGKTLNTDNAKIELAEIPFVKLREKLTSIFGENETNFERMVQIFQNEIDLIKSVFPLVLNINKRKIEVGTNVISFTPLLFSVYNFLAKMKLEDCKYPERKSCLNCNECFKSIVEITDEDNLKKILLCYEKMYRPDSAYYEKLEDRFDKEYLLDNFRQYFSKVNREIEKILGEESDLYRISAAGKYGTKRYGLKIEKSKIKIVE